MSKGNVTLKFRCDPELLAWIKREYALWTANGVFGYDTMSDFIKEMLVREMQHRERSRTYWKRKRTAAKAIGEICGQPDLLLTEEQRPNTN